MDRGRPSSELYTSQQPPGLEDTGLEEPDCSFGPDSIVGAILDSKLKKAISATQSEGATRASFSAEVQGEAIEGRLQLKLDAAMAASRLDCHKYVDASMKDVACTLSQGLDAVRRDMESKQVAHANCVEKPMQQMLWEARGVSQTAVATIEHNIQDAVLHTQEHRRKIDDRLDNN